MTLYRQLLSFTLALCFILFVGVCLDKVHSTKTFLENQLSSHAQDTATSLGLSLSPFIAKGDMAAVDTIMNAIFDRGYYRSIILRDLNQQIISQRILDISLQDIPDWFIKLIPINTPQAESLIMNGWRQAGTIQVSSHPGYAYETLWQTAVTVTIYFLLTGIVVFLLGGLGLRVLLKPLRRVEKQAEAICQHKYEIQGKIPYTRELRQVVTSMNKMTAKVKEMFEEQAAIAEKLREHAFADPLTGLGNRRYLTAQVSSVMREREDIVKGAFLLIQIHDLHGVNVKKGYNIGDELVKGTAQIISENAALWADATAARLGGGDFILFLPNIDAEDCNRLAAEVISGIVQLATKFAPSSEHICNLGGIMYHQGTSLEHLLSAADAALGEAMLKGPNQSIIKAISSSGQHLDTRGKVWWQETLERALAQNAITLYAQRVIRSSDRETTDHLELFSRILVEGTETAAAVFIPMAERSGLITELDRCVVETVIRNHETWGNEDLAINISVTSLLDSAFVDWLRFRLAGMPPKRNRLIFEFPEFNAVQNLDPIRVFSQIIKGTGHGIALDQFGRSFSNFGYLRSIRPDYVKIDAAFTRALTSVVDDSYFFISALKSVARSLDIKVFAEGVETKDQFEILQELNIDGMGGYLIEQPRRFIPVQ